MSRRIWTPTEYDDFSLIDTASISVPATTASVDELNSTGVYSWSFTNGEILGFIPAQISHAYAEGTALVPHIHWCPTTTETYTGTWTLVLVDWLSTTTGSAIQAAATLTAAFNTSMTAWQMQSADFSATLTGTNRKISSIVGAKLTLALTAGTRCHLLGLDMHYQKDRIGSALISSKT